MCSNLNSLENLSRVIDRVHYYNEKEIGLNENEMVDLHINILSGRYRLSPFNIEMIPIDECIKYNWFLIYHDNNEYGLIITASESDLIVLTALGKVLNDIIGVNGYNHINQPITTFYEDVLFTKENIDNLYRIDLSYSLMTIDQDKLITDLYHLLGKGPIFDLVQSFIQPEYNEYDEDGKRINLPLSIPPLTMLTNVLLNYEFNKLDDLVADTYDKIDYNRHMNEAYITNIDEKDLKYLKECGIFEYLGLVAHIYSIKRGTNAPCFLDRRRVGLDINGNIYID